MRLDDVPGYGETETQASLCDRAVALTEAFEEMRDQFRIDSFSVVGDDNLRPRVDDLDTQQDMTAGGSELHRVREEVPDDLFDSAAVAMDHGRPPRKLEPELDLFRLGDGSDHVGGRLCQRIEIDRTDLHLKLAENDARDIEQILDEELLRACALRDAFRGHGNRCCIGAFAENA